jgi:hypothetical protein
MSAVGRRPVEVADGPARAHDPKQWSFAKAVVSAVAILGAVHRKFALWAVYLLIKLGCGSYKLVSTKHDMFYDHGAIRLPRFTITESRLERPQLAEPNALAHRLLNVQAALDHTELNIAPKLAFITPSNSWRSGRRWGGRKWRVRRTRPLPSIAVGGAGPKRNRRRANHCQYYK